MNLQPSFEQEMYQLNNCQGLRLPFLLKHYRIVGEQAYYIRSDFWYSIDSLLANKGSPMHAGGCLKPLFQDRM